MFDVPQVAGVSSDAARARPKRRALLATSLALLAVGAVISGYALLAHRTRGVRERTAVASSTGTPGSTSALTGDKASRDAAAAQPVAASGDSAGSEVGVKCFATGRHAWRLVPSPGWSVEPTEHADPGKWTKHTDGSADLGGRLARGQTIQLRPATGGDRLQFDGELPLRLVPGERYECVAEQGDTVGSFTLVPSGGAAKSGQ